MTVTRRALVTLVTPSMIYRAHTFEHDEDARSATFTDRRTGQVAVMLANVESVSKDSNTWRLEGDMDGERVVCRAVKACACSGSAVFETPAYERDALALL